MANTIGLPTTDSISVEGSPNDSIEVIESHQQERDLADAISHRGIIPDERWP